jgi:hypothetical protein
MNNSLNFKKKFTIPKLSKIADDILKENNDRNMIIRTRPGSVIPYNPKIKSVKDLISRLTDLSGYKETASYVNQTQKLEDISIINRIYKLLLIIYTKNIKIDILDASNLLGILAFIVFNTQNVQNYFIELDNYIRYIKKKFKDDNYDDKILLGFLYDLTEYKNKPNKPVNNVKNYYMFIEIYKSRFKQFNYKPTYFNNLNRKVKKYMEEEKNKAKAEANAIAEAKAKAEANALAVAKANAEEKNKECSKEWEIYNKYKKNNPSLFKLRIGRPNRPTCNINKYRPPKKNNKSKNETNKNNRSKSQNTVSSNNLKNNNSIQLIQT